MSEIWVKHPSVLFTETKLKEFIPTSEMTYSEKINALTRLIIYVSCLVFIIRGDPFMLLVPICVMVVIYFLFSWKDVDEDFMSFEKPCQEPTIDNPFMNVLPTDDRTRPPACEENKLGLKEQINDSFEFNLYQNTNDIFGNKNSQRQYYTMPNTSIPNKQNELAQWLYNTCN
jgi:hypothetical protein